MTVRTESKGVAAVTLVTYAAQPWSADASPAAATTPTGRDKWPRAGTRGGPGRTSNVARSLIAASLLAGHVSAAAECPHAQTLLLVDTKAHELKLCEDGVTVSAFRVALGRGGTDKRQEGDNKTPLGRYALGAPRGSARFGVFLPVGYPTKEQSAKGFTGANIGVHGPDRHFAWLGRANLWFDWTAGCVAVGTDQSIQAIAAWVQEKSVTLVELQ
jgi:hypothetical protein